MTNDPVNHPSHYANGKYEVIEFIESWNLGFHLGNAVKYISRAGKKDPSKMKEDLQKALWYLRRYIPLPIRTVQEIMFGEVKTIDPVDFTNDKQLVPPLSTVVQLIIHSDCQIAADLLEWYIDSGIKDSNKETEVFHA